MAEYAINPVVRNQLRSFKGDGELQQAVKAWYDGLDDAMKREVEAAVQAISATMRSKCPGPFGVGSALELLAALIAFDQGWLSTDACRARHLRLKYDQRHRHHHAYGAQDERAES